MELKKFNKCLVFLSDFIDAKISYFDCHSFVNMYTECKNDDSEGKLYLVYNFGSNYELSKKIQELSNNKYYYNWFTTKIDNKVYTVFSFKVTKDKIDDLEFCKKNGRYITSYVDARELLFIWKDYLEDFDDLLSKNLLDNNYTCTC